MAHSKPVHGSETDTLKKVLLEGNYITEAELKKAEAGAKEERMPLAAYITSKDILNKDLLGQAFAEHYDMPYADLNSNPPSKDQLLKIPENIGRKYRIVLFKDGDKKVTIATDKPRHDGLIEALEKAFKRKVTLAYSLPEDIDTAFQKYAKPLETRFQKIIDSSERVAPEILDEIFAEAITLRASDIHFEPRADEVEVRFRIDGVLHETGHIPKTFYENILNRLKVLAHERIDEHQVAQDGVLRFEHEGVVVDMRSSVVPTIDGEKVVLRLLTSNLQGLALPDLGLSAKNEKMIRDAAEKPFGMILVVGPTGSGKTTTLYALLKIFNRPDVNITTIEDPVEYKMQGVNQIQVNPQANLTFAQGLRTIVRQDPDIILVGEIRDKETAEIAVNAALTGHLLLSTFHANDAATAIPRLLDMEIEPFLLSSTLVVVVAQRLARKICESCRVSIAANDPMWSDSMKRARAFFSGTKTLYYGKGCPACNNTGYKGRTGLFEFIVVSSELQELILKNPSAQEIWKLARTQGSTSLFEDGVDKVKAGITTLDELLRVAEPPEDIR